MDVETIKFMYDYDFWVSMRLLEEAKKLDRGKQREKLGASFDTIHNTLGHILGAQMIWLQRWNGHSPMKEILGDDFESVDAIESAWHEHQDKMRQFISGLTPEKLDGMISYQRHTGERLTLPLGRLMLHVVNHGTHHRSELADMLTRSGYQPRPTDITQYLKVLHPQG